VDLLLTQPEAGGNGIENDWYNLAKALASRADRSGRQARGEAIERLAAAKAEAERLRREKDEVKRRRSKLVVEGRGLPMRPFRHVRNANQGFYTIGNG
jgi:hypothetical protein